MVLIVCPLFSYSFDKGKGIGQGVSCRFGVLGFDAGCGGGADSGRGRDGEKR